MMKHRIAALGAGVSLALAAALAIPLVAFAATVLPNGFTAKVVAHSDQRISGSIDATGYDLGIYIGPGVHNVAVVGATVSGANDEGILVQDASDVVIRDSTVTGNAIDPASGLSEIKGIALVGTAHAVVRDNTVESNDHGGIGIYDDGPNSPFAPTAIDGHPVAGIGNVIAGNVVKDNLNDCGIVLAAKNPGGGVVDNVIARNTVTGFDPAVHDFVPGVGGIIVAGGAFGPVRVTDNVVSDNVVTGGFIPGISLHAFGPGVISGTQVTRNVLSDNGAGEVSLHTTGIEIFAAPHVGTIVGTQVLNERVMGDYFGVFHLGDTGTHIVRLTTNATVPVFP